MPSNAIDSIRERVLGTAKVIRSTGGDDSTAVNEAIVSGAKNIWLPDTTYDIGTTLLIRNRQFVNFHFDGELRWIGGVGSIIEVNASQYCKVGGGELDGNGLAGTCLKIWNDLDPGRSYNTIQGKFYDMQIRGAIAEDDDEHFHGAGIHLGDDHLSPYSGQVSECQFLNVSSIGNRIGILQQGNVTAAMRFYSLNIQNNSYRGYSHEGGSLLMFGANLGGKNGSADYYKAQTAGLAQITDILSEMDTSVSTIVCEADTASAKTQPLILTGGNIVLASGAVGSNFIDHQQSSNLILNGVRFQGKGRIKYAPHSISSMHLHNTLIDNGSILVDGASYDIGTNGNLRRTQNRGGSAVMGIEDFVSGPYRSNILFGTARLSADIASGDTTVPLEAGTGSRFPASSFYIKIRNEYMRVTSRTDDDLTVVRGQLDGTSGQAHTQYESVTGFRRMIWQDDTTTYVQAMDGAVSIQSFDGTEGFHFSNSAGPAANTKIGMAYGTAAPSSGFWPQGSICFKKDATAGGFVGWVCTTQGTPGTWKEFGAIEA